MNAYSQPRAMCALQSTDEQIAALIAQAKGIDTVAQRLADLIDGAVGFLEASNPKSAAEASELIADAAITIRDAAWSDYDDCRSKWGDSK
jgi:predicted TIM-barrel enzyme